MRNDYNGNQQSTVTLLLFVLILVVVGFAYQNN